MLIINFILVRPLSRRPAGSMNAQGWPSDVLSGFSIKTVKIVIRATLHMDIRFVIPPHPLASEASGKPAQGKDLRGLASVVAHCGAT